MFGALLRCALVVALFPLSLLAGAVLGLLLGGRLSSLGRTRLRAVGLVLTALAVEIALGLASSHQLLAIEVRLPLLVSADLLVGWWIALNLPGRPRPEQLALGAVGLGWLANLLVMTAYGAMPVSRAALRDVGLGHIDVGRGHLGKHLLASHGPSGWMALGDWIPVRALATVLSPGDIVMAVGICAFVAMAMRRSTPLSPSALSH